MKFFECRNCHYEFVEMPLSRFKLEHKVDPEDHKKVFSGLDEGVKAYCPNCHAGILEKNVTFNYVLKDVAQANKRIKVFEKGLKSLKKGG